MNEGELCQILDWDTRYWGFPIARVHGSTLAAGTHGRVIEWCRENEVRCLYFLANAMDPETIRWAEADGYHLVDVRVGLKRSLADECGYPTAAPNLTVRPARPEDRGALVEIAGLGYRDTRFAVDPGFTPERCRQFYETWLQVSLEGYAQQVLVANLNGEPLGYITCHVDSPETGRIGLVGVNRLAQHQGVGRALVHGALAWFSAAGSKEVVVVTQGRNVAALRLYQRYGFFADSLALWYHKWFE
jgi:dTDP-4-amino-4,6-dideoxy-D-galactose acyltransferase